MSPQGQEETRGKSWSIRTKLILGAGLIAALTILTALVAGYGAWETSRQLARIETAQARIEHLAAISTRISDYAITAVDSATAEFVPELAEERLTMMAATVTGAFDRARDLAVGTGGGDSEQTGRLLLSLGRMQALFAAMDSQIRAGLSATSPATLSASLDTFSSQFSPLLTEAISAEQVKRQDAVARISVLRRAFGILSVAVIALTVLLLALFASRIIGPILSRIGRIGAATQAIGAGQFRIDLPTEPADELGVLFRHTNEMAEALSREKARVEADRRQLNDLVAARTTELTQANMRLSEADAQRRRFFADVSHELRTPLTVILAEAELSQGGSAEDMSDSLGVIFTRARKLNQRVDDLLRIARSESGQIELDLKPTGLEKIVREAAQDMEPLLRRKGVALQLEAAPVAPVRADRDWIRQIIGGLIENALKHAPAGSQISITLTQREDAAVLQISDQGGGLDPATAQAAFERFRKGRGEAPGGGFGIGLSLAKWVVEEHGGTIALSEADGGGLRVETRLPLA